MDAGVYSQELMATINRMTDDHDSEHTQDISYLIKVIATCIVIESINYYHYTCNILQESSEWIKNQSNIDGELSVNGVLEKLSSYASVEVNTLVYYYPI